VILNIFTNGQAPERPRLATILAVLRWTTI